MSKGFPLHDSAVHQLIGLAYASVHDGSRWPALLDAFARAVNTPRCALLISHPDGDEFSVVQWHGWPDEDIHLYTDRYGPQDPLLPVSLMSPEGTVAADHDLCPRDAFESSTMFREFYAPRDCIHSMGGVILASQADRSIISAHRGQAAGPFGEAEKSILRLLMPHLKQAAVLHGELGSLRRRVATFTAHLERYPNAFLLTDAGRRVLYSNKAARAIFSDQDGLCVRKGRIAATVARCDRELASAMEGLTAPSAPLRRLEISRPSRRKPYRMLLMPMNDSRPLVPLGIAVPAVSIILIDTAASWPDPQVLREFFQFTPAEARVCARLTFGQSAEEIAAESKTSIETVRTHIKRIFTKTATTRQSELVSLVLRSVAFPGP